MGWMDGTVIPEQTAYKSHRGPVLINPSTKRQRKNQNPVTNFKTMYQVYEGQAECVKDGKMTKLEQQHFYAKDHPTSPQLV